MWKSKRFSQPTPHHPYVQWYISHIPFYHSRWKNLHSLQSRKPLSIPQLFHYLHITATSLLIPRDQQLYVTIDNVIHTLTPPSITGNTTPHRLHLSLNPHDRLPYLRHIYDVDDTSQYHLEITTSLPEIGPGFSQPQSWPMVRTTAHTQIWLRHSRSRKIPDNTNSPLWPSSLTCSYQSRVSNTPITYGAPSGLHNITSTPFNWFLRPLLLTVIIRCDVLSWNRDYHLQILRLIQDLRPCPQCTHAYTRPFLTNIDLQKQHRWWTQHLIAHVGYWIPPHGGG